MSSVRPNLNKQPTAAKRPGFVPQPRSAGVLPRQPAFRRTRVLVRKTTSPRGPRGRERGLDQPFLPLLISPPRRRSLMMQTRRAPRTDGVLTRDRGGGLNSGNRRKSGGGGGDDCRDDDDGRRRGGLSAHRGGVGGRRQRPGLRQRRPGRLKRSLQQPAVELGLSGARSYSRRPRREISIETVTNTDAGVRTRPVTRSQLGALSRRHRLPRRRRARTLSSRSLPRGSRCVCVSPRAGRGRPSGRRLCLSRPGAGVGGRPGSTMASGAGGIGGGGGGGKIRTRRCHQGPVKPYQQGRPQHQVRGPARRGGLGGSERPQWRGGAVRGPGSPRGADQGTRGPEAGPGWRREVGRAWRGLAAHTWGAGGLSQPSRPGAFPGGRRAGKEIPGFVYSGFFFGGFWGFDGITHDLAREQGKEMWQQAHRLAGFISFSFQCSLVEGAWRG